ncbi:hypothetical protein [Actinacidiphila acidipaludis]|uniref:Uncharacterized protein n=1 Tax=Actinacidiphila acidipaludis TaxID=2873382 RepID=A0ABS7Q2T3_9ACTN|nr:hypothetical protein [Streptomyces acidipaludis]MBY8876089.1 hypothetical protein [Streptomyces acidipaludis]
MCGHHDKHTDALAACVALAAEAAVLSARCRMLQEDLASVDARIRAVSESLRRLRHDGAESGPEADDDRLRGQRDKKCRLEG